MIGCSPGYGLRPDRGGHERFTPHEPLNHLALDGQTECRWALVPRGYPHRPASAGTIVEARASPPIWRKGKLCEAERPPDVVPPRPQSASGSQRSLAQSYELRNFCASRGKISSVAPKPKRCSSAPWLFKFDETDLKGGNGKWRQKLAEKDFVEKEEAAERLRRRREARHKERCRIREEEEAAARQAREAAEAAKRKEQEKERLARLAEEAKKRKEEEELQRQREEEERERKALEPVPCKQCNALGHCPVCLGRGFSWTYFLAPTVQGSGDKARGCVAQGCSACGGLEQNVVGQLRKGTGKCSNCGGLGMVHPLQLVTLQKRTLGRRNSGTMKTDEIGRKVSFSGGSERRNSATSLALSPGGGLRAASPTAS